MKLEDYSWSTCSKQPRRVDRCRSRQLVRPSTSFVDTAIDLTWRNFLRPEFGTMFQPQGSEVPLFLYIPEFIYNTLCDRWKETSIQLDSSGRFDTIPACDIRTDGRQWRHFSQTLGGLTFHTQLLLRVRYCNA